MVLRSSRFASHRCFESVAESRTYARTMVHHITEHINHLVGGSFADNLIGLRSECCQNIAIVILDTSDIEWLHADTLVWEGSICIHHLLNAHLAWAKAKTDHWVKLTLNTERTHHAYQLFWSKE